MRYRRKREGLANCNSAVKENPRCREGQSTRGGSGEDLLQEAASIARTKLARNIARTRERNSRSKSARPRERSTGWSENARPRDHTECFHNLTRSIPLARTRRVLDSNIETASRALLTRKRQCKTWWCSEKRRQNTCCAFQTGPDLG